MNEIPGQIRNNNVMAATASRMTNFSLICRILTSPFRLIKFFIDMSLSALVLTVFIVIIAWCAGFISQETSTKFLINVGDRGTELARSLGIPI
jgi:hypothetical protein